MTKKSNWESIRSVTYNGCRLSLVARRTRAGKLVQPGLTFEVKVGESFPQLIFGGDFPAQWNSAKKLFAAVKEQTDSMTWALSLPPVEGDCGHGIEEILGCLECMWGVLSRPSPHDNLEHFILEVIPNSLPAWGYPCPYCE